MKLERSLAVVAIVAGSILITGCQGSSPSNDGAATALPSIDPNRVVRGADGFGTYPNLNDDVVCHTKGGSITKWQTPRNYDWDKGGAGGALAGTGNHDITASDLPNLFATYNSGTARAYSDRIEFYDYRIDGNNFYSTSSKDATITLNGTLHCTVFIDENGNETQARSGTTANPSESPAAESAAPPDDTASSNGTVNTPGEAATEYYQTQGRGDWAGTCAVIDPQAVPPEAQADCAAGYAQLYEALPDPELSAFLSTYVVPDSDVTITGDTAVAIVAPGPKWTTTTTLDLVRRGDRWYVDYSLFTP